MILIFLSIVINFFIETLSWYIKSISLPGNIAKSISISNMILYSSRIFNYLFITSISLYIDRDYNLNLLIATLLLAMFISFFLHYFFFTSKFCVIQLKKLICLICISNTRLYNVVSKLSFKKLNRKILDGKVFFYTIISSFIFSSTLIIPYILTYYIPQYKLTIVSFGSIGNFLATIPLIFYVDYIMHTYMDKSILGDFLYSYILGRSLGFLLFAILFTLYLVFYY
jgi:hypothetical protein